tara:strand:+ start:103 stop:399 length:297 start_codon:yes stop_codon:yes gene_type:complete
MKYKTVKFTNSERDKKFKAELRGDKVKKTLHFGAKGMSDFTKHKDNKRKVRYLARHRVRENWKVPDTAGSLSRWILWNKDTIEASKKDYAKRFSLKII